MPTHHRLQLRLAALLIATAAVTVAALPIAAIAAGHAASVPALPAAPRTPSGEPAAIEAFAPDQSQFFCRHTVEPGVKAFEALVLKTYRNTASDGDMRACDDGATSEHKDGRAWDWGADHRNPAQRAAGESMLRWLFATDAHGNRDAMFRRLGLMYVIWNKRIWGAWDGRWEPYSCSGVTACHVDHMHFSFGWAGAEKKTSFWTHRVGGVVEPPLPTLSALHAHRTLQVPASVGGVTAHWLLRGGATYRVTATGAWQQGQQRRDAHCVKSAKGWAPSPRGGATLGGDQLQGWGLQWTPTHDNGSGCNPTSHSYQLVLTTSHSSTVSVELPSGKGKSSGHLTVRFVRTG